MSHPLIIGHRGASAHAPENTLAAFARALDDGADGLEFDVRLACDGVPIVIHDATLKRTGGRAVAVAALTADELGAADVGSWFNRRFPRRARPEYAREGVPTLARVLAECAPRSPTLYIELKCTVAEAPALAEAVVAVMLKHAEAVPRIVIESFTLNAIREIKQRAPDLRTAALFERRLIDPLPSPRRLIEQARAHDADEIALQRTLASARTVAAARAAGFNVVVWTIDHAAWLARARAFGIHALITNHPARMIQADSVRYATGKGL